MPTLLGPTERRSGNIDARSLIQCGIQVGEISVQSTRPPRREPLRSRHVESQRPRVVELWATHRKVHFAPLSLLLRCHAGPFGTGQLNSTVLRTAARCRCGTFAMLVPAEVSSRSA